MSLSKRQLDDKPTVEEMVEESLKLLKTQVEIFKYVQKSLDRLEADCGNIKEGRK